MARGVGDASLLPIPGPGRPKGSKNKKPSIVALMANVFKTDTAKIQAALKAGLVEKKHPRGFQYHQLAAQYFDGKPVERVEHSGQVTQRVEFVLDSEE